ncbi:MAG TPA: MFS transporter [Natronosporangium sp.]
MTATSDLSYWRVLRLRSVSPLLGSALCSRLASEIFTVAIVLHVYDRFDSPPLAGWVVAASAVPGLVVSPLAGAILDRFGPARGMVIDVATATCLVAAIALVEPGGTGGAALLVGLAAGYSLTRPLSLAGFRTLLPRLVPESARDRANAIDIGLYDVTTVAGTALAGGLFVLLGGRVTLLIVASLYAGAALALLPVLARRVPGAGGRARLLTAALDAISYSVRHPVLRGLAVSYSLYSVAWGVLVVSVPIAVVAATGGQVREDGALVGGAWAMVGITGALGALVVGKLRTAGRERRFIAVGVLVTALAVYPVIGHGGAVGLVAGLLLVGSFGAAVNVGVLTLRQRRTDPAMLGRVIAVSISLNLFGEPVGAALGGWLADRALPLALAAGGAAAAAGAIASLLLIPPDPPDREPGPDPADRARARSGRT